MGKSKYPVAFARLWAVLTPVLIIVGAFAHDPGANCNAEIVDVSYGTQVTIYERTTDLLIKTYSVETLMGPGGTFFTVAQEEYTITSDGKYVKIHCYRPAIDGGGSNIEAVRLEGVPGLGGLWASVIIDYTLGTGGIVSSVVNALGGDYNSTYTILGDDHSELILGFEVDVAPPYLYIESSANRNDIELYWSQPMMPALSHFLIYRSESQTDFDFSTVWKNTSFDVNPLTGVIDPLRMEWLDTDVTNTSHANYRGEYYYTIRAVNSLGRKGTTSNTVGYCVVHFNESHESFSLPLEHQWSLNLDVLMLDMDADAVSWLDQNDDWQTYPSNSLTPSASIGKGYVAEFSKPSRYVFTGEPAAMVIYQDGFGFDHASRNSISASIDANGNITVSWMPIPGADSYRILKTTFRNGFHTGNCQSFNVTSPPFMDIGAAGVPGGIYYMVVPYNATLGDGSSTYSIGVITEEYNGNEMFGLPLKPIWGDRSTDWYADQIPNALGIVYLESGEWKAHFEEFPEGVYDTIVERARGYELSVYESSLFSYIGW
jgi:hypothetical protein